MVLALICVLSSFKLNVFFPLFSTVYYLQEMASSKSLMNLLTFTFGSAIGFFVCYLLFSIILEEQVKIQPHILHNDPHGQHSADIDNNQLQGQMNFNADSGQHKGILLHLTNYIICLLFMHCKVLHSSLPRMCMNNFLSLSQCSSCI